MKKEIKNSRFDVLTTSLDENSKKIQKLKIKIKGSTKFNRSMPASLQMDMKSVRVLVERTKFNVMLNLEHKLNKIRDNQSLKTSEKTSSSSTSTNDKEIEEDSNTPFKKLSNKNGPLASSTPQRPQQQQSPQKTSQSETTEAAAAATATATVVIEDHQQNIDEIFKIRKCCIKIPKDKLLFQLQQEEQHQMPYPVKLIVHSKSRGRPKKQKDNQQSDADNLLMVDSSCTSSITTAEAPVAAAENDASVTGTIADIPSTGQKRKSSEKQSSVSPPKRKIKKGNEFFIKIGALTRTPSPKRKLTSNSCSPEDKPPLTSKQRRKTAKKLNTKTLASSRLAPLRQKFGNRFFKSFVKIKRMIETNSPNNNVEQPSLSYSPPKTADIMTPKKKNSKNLTVSFLETVEIFGESSDEDDWFESDAKNALRNTKPLDSLFDSLKASTPCIRNSSSSANNNSNSDINSSNSSNSTSNSNSSSILKSSILDRKEKKSFSPLKETESPRKQQLKKANESFVRSSLETQIDEEERDNAEDWTTKWKAIPFRLEKLDHTYIFGSKLTWNSFQLPSRQPPSMCRCFCHLRRPFKDSGFKMFNAVI